MAMLNNQRVYDIVLFDIPPKPDVYGGIHSNAKKKVVQSIYHAIKACLIYVLSISSIYHLLS